MVLLECKELALGYAGRTVAEHVSFTLKKGDYLCIVGENGSGKSTLIKTLLGLNKPLSGDIVRSEEFSPRRIGYMPQKTPLQKDFPASVREIVLSGFLGAKGYFGFYSKEDKRRMEETAERLGIRALIGRSIRELSGGQQQRVFLARALCAARDVLLVDEPCAGLDAKGAEELYTLLAELHEKDGLTVIMVTHDAQAVERYATSVLHLGQDTFFREISGEPRDTEEENGNE